MSTFTSGPGKLILPDGSEHSLLGIEITIDDDMLPPEWYEPGISFSGLGNWKGFALEGKRLQGAHPSVVWEAGQRNQAEAHTTSAIHNVD